MATQPSLRTYVADASAGAVAQGFASGRVVVVRRDAQKLMHKWQTLRYPRPINGDLIHASAVFH